MKKNCVKSTSAEWYLFYTYLSAIIRFERNFDACMVEGSMIWSATVPASGIINYL